MFFSPIQHYITDQRRSFSCLSLSQTHFNPVHKRVGWIWVSRLGVSQSQTCEKRNQSTKPPNYLSLPCDYISARAVPANRQSHTVFPSAVYKYSLKCSDFCLIEPPWLIVGSGWTLWIKVGRRGKRKIRGGDFCFSVARLFMAKPVT